MLYKKKQLEGNMSELTEERIREIAREEIHKDHMERINMLARINVSVVEIEKKDSQCDDITP